MGWGTELLAAANNEGEFELKSGLLLISFEFLSQMIAQSRNYFKK